MKLKSKPKAAPQPIAPATEGCFAEKGRFAYGGLDRVIHERARLSVLTSLITNPKGLLFNELKQLCSLTDGNLSRHLTVLESEHMVELLKESDRTRPQTICRITNTGRKRYLEYLTTLEQVVKDAAKMATTEAPAKILRNLNPSRA
jgi:DNA-binding transcriptional ArsR family regulator